MGYFTQCCWFCEKCGAIAKWKDSFSVPSSAGCPVGGTHDWHSYTIDYLLQLKKQHNDFENLLDKLGQKDEYEETEYEEDDDYDYDEDEYENDEDEELYFDDIIEKFLDGEYEDEDKEGDFTIRRIWDLYYDRIEFEADYVQMYKELEDTDDRSDYSSVEIDLLWPDEDTEESKNFLRECFDRLKAGKAIDVKCSRISQYGNDRYCLCLFINCFVE